MRPQKQKSYQQRKQFKKKFSKKGKRPLTFDQMLRQFKKKTERAGIVAECRKREYYEKPNQKRQRKKKEAIRREQLNQLNNNTLGRPRLF